MVALLPGWRDVGVGASQRPQEPEIRTSCPHRAVASQNSTMDDAASRSSPLKQQDKNQSKEKQVRGPRGPYKKAEPCVHGFKQRARCTECAEQKTIADDAQKVLTFVNL